MADLSDNNPLFQTIIQTTIMCELILDDPRYLAKTEHTGEYIKLRGW